MEFDLQYLICTTLVIGIAAWILDPVPKLLQFRRRILGLNDGLHSFAEIPGPRGLPFLGTVLHYIKNSSTSKERLMIHREYFEQYGPIYKETIMGKTVVYVHDPKDVETVFKAEGKYPKRVIPQFKAIEKYYKSRKMVVASLVQLENEEWSKLHKALAPKMLCPRDILENLENFNGVTRDAVEHLLLLRGLNAEVHDLEGEIAKYVAEFLGTVTLDVRIGLYDDPPNKETVKMLKETNKFFMFMERLGGVWEGLLLWCGLSSPAYREFRQAEDIAIAIGQKIVNQKLKEITELANEEEEFVDNQGTSLLTYLLNKKKLTAQEINLNSLDMLRSGINTTSTIMLWVLYDLARHPAVQDQVYEEVTTLVGCHGDFTPTSFSKLSYVKACIKESLRLHSISAGWSRVLSQDVVLSGYKVPLGTAVKYPDYLTGYSESLFKDPYDFKPERWLNEDLGKIQPFAILPWGVGPRMCIGRRIAEAAMYLLSAKLIQRFILEYHDEPVGTASKYFLVPDRPVRIKFIDRQ